MYEYLTEKLGSLLGAYFKVATRHVYSIEAVLYAALIMVAIYLLYRKRAGSKKIGIRDAIAFVFPSKIYTHKSAKLDYQFFFIDPLVKVLFLMPSIGPLMAAYGGAILFTRIQGLLVLWLGEPTYELILRESYPAIFAFTFTFVVALLYELIYYVQHYLTHKIPFLWEFHKTHHSAGVLTPAVTARVHPVDLYFILLGPLILLPVLLALIDHFLSSRLATSEVFTANAVVFFLKSLLPYFQHSHLRISYGRFLNHFFMSPVQHFFHHSHQAEHIDKNFGEVFSFWDWLFGTLYIPKKNEKPSIGLSSNEHEAYSSVWKLYALPFRNNIRAKQLFSTTVLILVLVVAAALSLEILLKKLIDAV